MPVVLPLQQGQNVTAMRALDAASTKLEARRNELGIALAKDLVGFAECVYGSQSTEYPYEVLPANWPEIDVLIGESNCVFISAGFVVNGTPPFTPYSPGASIPAIWLDGHYVFAGGGITSNLEATFQAAFNISTDFTDISFGPGWHTFSLGVNQASQAGWPSTPWMIVKAL